MSKKIKPVFISLLLLAVFLAAICAAKADPHSGCALYCVDDKELIIAENAQAPIAPASLTKLLTAVVALNHVGSGEVFTVGTELKLADPHSSVCFIAPGHRLKLYDLISGMLLVSGNDAAYTVAVSVARRTSGNEDLSDEQAVEYFCGMMNDLAAELGMTGSRFANPDGWDDPGHYTTVSDLIKLSEYALTFPEINEITRTRQRRVVFESGQNITWKNSNKLLDPDSRFYCEEAVGLKTGTTEKAGNCLIGAFEKDGKTYITVAAGCTSDSGRYRLTLKLLGKAK